MTELHESNTEPKATPGDVPAHLRGSITPDEWERICRDTVRDQLALEVPNPPPLEPMKHECPHCGARAGERCTTPAGNPIDVLHLARRRVARFLPVAR